MSLNPWQSALLVQVIALALATAFARFRFGLEMRTAAIATAILLPAPLFLATNGIAGAIYAADFVGILGLALAVRRNLHRKQPLPLAFGVLLLFLMPLTCSAAALIGGTHIDFRRVMLACLRSSSYLGALAWASILSNTPRKRLAIVGTQVTFLSLIAACGLLQVVLKFDLNAAQYLWNQYSVYPESRDIPGFMGLYRGSVGAIGAIALAALPVLAATRALPWPAIAAMLITFIVGMAIVGTRQGIVIGAVALVTGVLSTTLVGLPKSLRAWSTAAITVPACLLLWIFNAMYAGTAPEKQVARIVDMLQAGFRIDEAANRDPKLPAVIDQIRAALPLRLILGTGIVEPSSSPNGSSDDLTYVDSELIWQAQQIGIVGVLLYISFLLTLLGKCWNSARAIRQDPVIALVGASVLTGTILTIGHFYLLQVYYFHATTAAWAWFLIGIGGAALAATRHTARPCLTQRRTEHSILCLRPYR